MESPRRAPGDHHELPWAKKCCTYQFTTETSNLKVAVLVASGSRQTFYIIQTYPSPQLILLRAIGKEARFYINVCP